MLLCSSLTQQQITLFDRLFFLQILTANVTFSVIIFNATFTKRKHSQLPIYMETQIKMHKIVVMHNRTIVSFSWSSLPSKMESVFCNGRLIPPAVKVAAVAAAEADEEPINWNALPLRWGEMLPPWTSD